MEDKINSPKKNTNKTSKTINLSHIIENIMKDEKKVKLIVIAGFIVIIAIFFSSFFQKSEDEKKVTNDNYNASNQCLEEYTKTVEDKVKAFVSGISGVGESSVMVTFENEIQYIYQSDIKSSSGDNNASQHEESIVIVEKDGEKQALIQTIIPPKIQGIAVCCEGGNDPKVEFLVTDALTKAFSIKSTQVSITSKTKLAR